MADDCKDIDDKPLSLAEFNKYFKLVKIVGDGSHGYVYECIDHNNFRLCAMKIVASYKFSSIEDFKQETDKVCRIWNLFQEYLDTLHPVWYRGYIEPEIIDLLKIPIKITSDDDDEDDDCFEDDYYFEDDEEKLFVSYMTMPLIVDNEDIITAREALDIYFEIVLSIIYLNINGYQHNDLHGGNIMIRQIDYDRIYTINHQRYIIKSKHQPVIIDWGELEPHDFYCDDLTKFSHDFPLWVEGKLRSKIPRKLFRAIKKIGYKAAIFDIKFFEPLKIEQSGSKVKYLKSIFLK